VKIKKIKHLEELDCPYIKRCALEGSEILNSCKKGGYIDCSIYLSNKKLEEEKS